MRHTAEILFFVYITALTMLLAAAAATWRLHCESFGCMGVGVAWFAWSIAFVVILPLGLVARSKARAVARFAKSANMACWLQGAMGVAVIAAWLLHG